MRLKLETLTLILNPQSAVFLADRDYWIRVMVSGPIFNTLFRFRVRVRVIIGYDVTFNISTGVRIKLQIVMCIFYQQSALWNIYNVTKKVYAEVYSCQI